MLDIILSVLAVSVISIVCIGFFGFFKKPVVKKEKRSVRVFVSDQIQYMKSLL